MCRGRCRRHGSFLLSKNPPTAFKALGVKAKVSMWVSQSPEGPIHPFLDGPPPASHPGPLSSPSDLCCSFHKHRQPLGLCTGCSLCLERSSPMELLGLSPSAPCKDFAGCCLTQNCTCPSTTSPLCCFIFTHHTRLCFIITCFPCLRERSRALGWFVN